MSVFSPVMLRSNSKPSVPLLKVHRSSRRSATNERQFLITFFMVPDAIFVYINTVLGVFESEVGLKLGKVDTLVKKPTKLVIASTCHSDPILFYKHDMTT